jgi:hypothetical protein
MSKDTLTEKQEKYCQLRAQGKTKTDAARMSFDGKHPSQTASDLEKRNERVRLRILQLKGERMEMANLDFRDQLTKYHQIYQMAVDQNNLSVSLKALERIDALGGFDAPTKTTTTLEVTPTDNKELIKGDSLGEDLLKFQNIIEVTPLVESED